MFENQENSANPILDEVAGSAAKPMAMLRIQKTMATEEQAPPEDGGSINKTHICKECNRCFSSGKALGGHMSSAHVQAQANKDISLKKLKSKMMKRNGTSLGIGCKICGKDFPSRKSLFGHMRSHPERHWRGMDPPVEKSEDSNGLRPDYDELFYSDEEEDNRADSSPVVDLSGSLVGWGVTGKRGRQVYEPGPQSDDENELHVVVQQLIRLVNDPVPRKVEDVAIYPRGPEYRACGPDPKLVCENGEPVKKSMSSSSDEESGDGVEISSKAKRTKLVKCGTSSGSDEKLKSPVDMVENGFIREKGSDNPTYPTSFTCNKCGKSFLTYQALGGHRSSHNKAKSVSIQNTIDEVDHTNESGSSSKANSAIARDNANLHVCDVCGKGFFPNGQALGGHKKCHGTNIVDRVIPNCNDQAAFVDGSTQVNIVDKVPCNDQATSADGSTQANIVNRVPYDEDTNYANGSTQAAKRNHGLDIDLNEMPDNEV